MDCLISTSTGRCGKINSPFFLCQEHVAFLWNSICIATATVTGFHINTVYQILRNPVVAVGKSPFALISFRDAFEWIHNIKGDHKGKQQQ